jgi:cytochrome c nitrite reductase small subunit
MDREVNQRYKSEKNRKSILYIFISFLFVFIASPLLTFGAPESSPEDKSKFCINCHTMEAEYEAWTHSGAHRRKMCVDCHLANDNKFVYYLWKSIDGLKDMVVFYSGRVPDRITVSSHGEKVLQANCIRCHETTVMRIDTKRKCWDCHRRVTHMQTGIRETF